MNDRHSNFVIVYTFNKVCGRRDSESFVTNVLQIGTLLCVMPEAWQKCGYVVWEWEDVDSWCSTAHRLKSSDDCIQRDRGAICIAVCLVEQYTAIYPVTRVTERGYDTRKAAGDLLPCRSVHVQALRCRSSSIRAAGYSAWSI